MPTTYDLIGWAGRLAELLDEVGDHEDPQALEALEACADAYDASMTDKVGALVHVLQSLEAHALVAKADKQRAADAEAHWKRQQARVRGLLSQLMQAHADLSGERKVSTTYATVSLSRRKEYSYPAEADWPIGWVQIVETVKVDKQAAKAAIDAGTAPMGFECTQVDSLAIRAKR